MSLQSQVYTDTASGVPGAKADANIFDYYPNSLVAEADITVGTFVWLGTDPATQAAYGGAGAPLGLVERNIVYPMYDVLEDGTEIVAEGETLTIATKGAFWVKTNSAAVPGQAVFAVNANGTIVTDAIGADVPNAVETGWLVASGGDADSVILIKRS